MSVGIDGDETGAPKVNAGHRIGEAAPPTLYLCRIMRCALLPIANQGTFGPGTILALVDYSGEYRQTRSRQLQGRIEVIEPPTRLSGLICRQFCYLRPAPRLMCRGCITAVQGFRLC